MLFISNHTHTTDILVLERFTSYAVADNSIFLDEAIEEGNLATILKYQCEHQDKRKLM